MEIVFSMVNVVKDKGTRFQKTVLKDLNMTIKDNSITGICGQRGKSTIGKLIPALESFNSGEIKVGKYILGSKKMVKNINDLRISVGYLYSNPADFLYHKTVEEEIEFGLKKYNYKVEQKELRTHEALLMVGLDKSYLDRNPRELSYAEQKKVMLAATLIYNPKVIIFDEFEKGLSRKDRDNLKKLIKLLKKEFNKTFVVITNEITFMLDLCDYVFALDDGYVELEGDKNIFFNDKLYQLVPKPEIVEFLEYADSKGRKFANYTDVNDLLKAVYRDVK